MNDDAVRQRRRRKTAGPKNGVLPVSGYSAIWTTKSRPPLLSSRTLSFSVAVAVTSTAAAAAAWQAILPAVSAVDNVAAANGVGGATSSSTPLDGLSVADHAAANVTDAPTTTAVVMAQRSCDEWRQLFDRLNHYFRDEDILHGSEHSSVQLGRLIVVCYALVIAFGTIGNLLTICAVLRSAQMRTVRNFFILNLALSDFFICTVTAPITLYTVLYMFWPFGTALCKIVGSLQGFNIFLSTFSIAAIALDRYVLVIFPTQRQRQHNLSLLFFSLIWLISILLALPLFYASDLGKVFEERSCAIRLTLCHEQNERWKQMALSKEAYTITVLFIQYACPLASIVFAYSRIASRMGTRFTSGGHNQNAVRQRHRFTICRSSGGGAGAANATTALDDVAAPDAGSGGGDGSAKNVPTAVVAAHQPQVVSIAIATGANSSTADATEAQLNDDADGNGCSTATTTGGNGAVVVLPNGSLENGSIVTAAAERLADGADAVAAGTGQRAHQSSKSQVSLHFSALTNFNEADRQRRSKSLAGRYRRTNFLLISIVCVFAAAWLPLNIFHLFNTFNTSHRFSVPTFAVCHCFAIGSACLNPVSYAFFNNNFRREFIAIFRRLRLAWLYERCAARVGAVHGALRLRHKKSRLRRTPNGSCNEAVLTSVTPSATGVGCGRLICCCCCCAVRRTDVLTNDTNNNNSNAVAAVNKPLIVGSAAMKPDCGGKEVPPISESKNMVLYNCTANGGSQNCDAENRQPLEVLTNQNAF